jgi:hypothetical protein
MTKISQQIKNQISSLSKSDLEKIVIKIAGKDQSVMDYLLVNFLDKQNGEADMFEKTKIDLQWLLSKQYKGFAEQLRLANMISACNNRIAEFSKVCKNKRLEVELLMFVIEEIFSVNLLGTCFTAYDHKLALMINKLTKLIETKLHPDYKIEYSEKINGFLSELKTKSYHISMVDSLPEKI